MTFLFDLLAIGSVLSGVLVITSSNPVVSVLFLVSVFVLAAGALLTLGVNFVGLAYLIVYVGAVAVLFLFVVMMLNVRVSEVTAVGLEHSKNLPLSALLCVIFLLELFSILPATGSGAGANLFSRLTALYLGVDASLDASHVANAFSSINADTALSPFTQIKALGEGLYTHGSLSLLLASFVLLLAMLGPILTCLRSDTPHHPLPPNYGPPQQCPPPADPPPHLSYG